MYLKFSSTLIPRQHLLQNTLIHNAESLTSVPPPQPQPNNLASIRFKTWPTAKLKPSLALNSGLRILLNFTRPTLRQMHESNLALTFTGTWQIYSARCAGDS